MNGDQPSGGPFSWAFRSLTYWQILSIIECLFVSLGELSLKLLV